MARTPENHAAAPTNHGTNFVAEVWRSLTREQQRMTATVAVGIVLTLLAYELTSALIALAVAAVFAYFVGRYRAGHRPEPPKPAPEPPTVVSARRPAPQRRVRPSPQTPLGRLFAERPGWSGPTVDPFEPPQRTPPEEQDPYDSA